MTRPRGTTPSWRRYLRFWRADIHADIDDELRFHFDERIESLVEGGATREAARAQALEEFGDVHAVTGRLREIDGRVARRRRWRDSVAELAQDVRYSARSLRRSPGLSLGILLTLALGVGANAMMLSFLDMVYFRPPAGVVDAPELRRVWYEIKFVDGPQFWPGFSYPQYRAVVETLGDRAATTLYEQPTTTRVNLGGAVLSAQISHTTATYFPVLGARPALGRVYAADEDRFDAPREVVVASDAFFRRVLGGDRSAIGRPIVVGGVPMTLIGVMQPGFGGAELNATDLWAPFPTLRAGARWWTQTIENGFALLIRPRAITDAELIERLSVAVRRTDDASNNSAAVVRLSGINRARGPGNSQQEVQIAVRLAGVALTVLLVACANVVNLLLSRAVRRRREVAVRLALGSSRARLVRLLLTESVLLAFAAGGVALAVAAWGGRVLRALLLPDVHWSQSPVDWRVGLAAVALALVAGVIAGLVPALQASSPRLGDDLKSGRGAGGVQRSRLRAILVGGQAALSVVLLVGALLFVKSLTKVRGLDIGFDASPLLMASLEFDIPQPGRTRALAPRLTALSQRIATMPGVEHVTVTNVKPMGGFSVIPFFTERDSLRRGPWFPTFVATTPEFFATTGIRLRGATLPRGGLGTAPGVVVNEEMARVLWPGREAIGQCLQLVRRASPCYRVVGVAEMSRMDKVIEDPHPIFYVSFEQQPPNAAIPRFVLVRARPSASPVVMRDLRALFAAEFPGSVPVVERLSDVLEPQYRPWRLGAVLFSAFGVLALLVAAIGIYSTVSFAVTYRTHEFGVRVALGARVSDVVRLVLGEGLRTVVAGTLLGVLLALAGGRLVSALLYGVSPGDPVSIAAVVTALLGVAVVAALAPAWRAARVDPVTALRAD